MSLKRGNTTSRGGARAGADRAGTTGAVSGNTCRGKLETGEGTGASGVAVGSVAAGIPGSNGTGTSEGGGVVAGTLLSKCDCWDTPGGDVFMAGTGVLLSNGAVVETGPSESVKGRELQASVAGQEHRALAVGQAQTGQEEVHVKP